MNNYYPFYLPLILLFVLIILVIFFVIFLKNAFFISNKIKYSFLNRFPFEAIYQKKNSLYPIFFTFLMIIPPLLITINGLFASSFKEGSTLAYAIIVGVIYSLHIIAAVLCFFVTPNYLKNFKLYSMLAIVLGILDNAMLGIISMNVYSHFSHKIIGAFAFVLMLANVILAFNPKLKNWDKLMEDKSSDGTIVYVRPKVSPLAMSLWINFLTLISGEGLILLNMLLLSILGE